VADGNLSSKPAEWRDEIRAIAKGWLFCDLPEGALPDTLLLPLENPDLHEHGSFVAHLQDVESFRCVTTGSYRGKRIGVLSSKFGAPAVAMTVETIADMGARRLIGVGYCGGLHPDVKCGDLIFPTHILRDDGTTPHYVPSSYVSSASEGLLSQARSLAANSTAELHFRSVWSTDAILMETTERIQAYVERGSYAVDMESGALYTIGALRGVEVVSILVASDHPGRQERTNLVRLAEGHQTAIALALALALS
jgi:purine-nucleoside phosphorylase